MVGEETKGWVGSHQGDRDHEPRTPMSPKIIKQETRGCVTPSEDGEGGEDCEEDVVGISQVHHHQISQFIVVNELMRRRFK